MRFEHNTYSVSLNGHDGENEEANADDQLTALMKNATGETGEERIHNNQQLQSNMVKEWSLVIGM